MSLVVTKESGPWSTSAICAFQGEIVLSPLSTRTKSVPTNPMPQAFPGLQEGFHTWRSQVPTKWRFPMEDELTSRRGLLKRGAAVSLGGAIDFGVSSNPFRTAGSG